MPVKVHERPVVLNLSITCPYGCAITRLFSEKCLHLGQHLFSEAAHLALGTAVPEDINKIKMENEMMSQMSRNQKADLCQAKKKVALC